MDLVKEIRALARRYHGEVRDLERGMRGLPPFERAIARTHANVKTSCANEIERLLLASGAQERR